jgi:hypothetical protein
MVLFIAVAALPLLALLVGGSPSPFMDASLRRRDANDTVEPQFPASPASCGVCSQASTPFHPFFASLGLYCVHP